MLFLLSGRLPIRLTSGWVPVELPCFLFQIFFTIAGLLNITPRRTCVVRGWRFESLFRHHKADLRRQTTLAGIGFRSGVKSTEVKRET